MAGSSRSPTLTLEAIVAEAIANNLDLKGAATKVAIAQQTVIVVGSQLLPWVGVQLDGTRTKDFDDGSFNSTSAFLGVAWELDVWGRLRAQREPPRPTRKRSRSTTR
jgi:outer membrane protein TolC